MQASVCSLTPLSPQPPGASTLFSVDGAVMQPNPPLVYAIGLEPITAAALYADLRRNLPDVVIRRRRSLRCSSSRRPRTLAPDLVLLDLNLPGLSAEIAAAQTAWGDQLVIVGIGRNQPFTLIWSGAGRPERVECGPGFLRPYLRSRRSAANSHQESRATTR
jgi:hypothetical protein